MNVIAVRQEQRINKINQIAESIKKVEKPVNLKDVIMATMSNLGVAKRTAREYIEIAVYQLGLKINEKGEIA